MSENASDLLKRAASVGPSEALELLEEAKKLLLEKFCYIYSEATYGCSKVTVGVFKSRASAQEFCKKRHDILPSFERGKSGHGTYWVYERPNCTKYYIEEFELRD